MTRSLTLFGLHFVYVRGSLLPMRLEHLYIRRSFMRPSMRVSLIAHNIAMAGKMIATSVKKSTQIRQNEKQVRLGEAIGLFVFRSLGDNFLIT